MKNLLRLRRFLFEIYNAYDSYVVFFLKFGLMLLANIYITQSVGFISILCNPFIIIGISALCALVPNVLSIVILAFFTVVHIYTMSNSLGIVVVCMMLIMYLLYFRLTPKATYVFVVTIVCMWLNIPYFLPLILALAFPAIYIITINFGVIFYCILNIISGYKSVITRDLIGDNMSLVGFLWNDFIRDYGLVCIMISFTVTYLVVHFIRRSSLNHAWDIAIVVGTIVHILSFVIISNLLNVQFDMVVFLTEVMITVVCSMFYKVMRFTLDYSKIEKFQMEDEDYYYYIKAVPKIKNMEEEVIVTHINAKDIKDKSNEKEN